MKLSFFLLLLFAGCAPKNGINFTVHNNSPDLIDSVAISTANRESIIKSNSISAQSTKTIFLSMQNTSKVDGGYLLTVYQGDKKRTEHFGYYTNGAALEASTHIHISSGTIGYKFNFLSY